MKLNKIDGTLPSRHFVPGIYGVGAWTDHLHFAYDLIAEMKPRLFVELGVDRGESYFAFCQSVAENKTGTQCFGVDTWRGDQHVGGYDETTFAQVSDYNRENYATFSTLIRSSFDEAREDFASASIDVLHLDGLHTEEAVRHDVNSWLMKIKPGGLLLLHDVEVEAKGFGVWRIWRELEKHGRSWTFHDGPGLGVWQKSPGNQLPGFLEQLLTSPNEENTALAQYYTERAGELQRKISEQWRDGTIRQTALGQQTAVQIFYSADGIHCEQDSVRARFGHEGWKDIRIGLPAGAAASPLRIDFFSALTTIDVASIRLTKAESIYFSAPEETGFDSIGLGGAVERLAHPTALRLKVTGVDPQLYLPVIPLPVSEEPLVLQMRLQVHTDR